MNHILSRKRNQDEMNCKYMKKSRQLLKDREYVNLYNSFAEDEFLTQQQKLNVFSEFETKCEQIYISCCSKWRKTGIDGFKNKTLC